MAVAIPVIAAFASAGAAVAAAGGIAAALGTVSGFLAIGGAALTAVGAVTKNTKLTKIGGFMGLAGGIGTALGLGAGAASAGAEAASAGAGATGMDFGAAAEAGTSAAADAGASSLQTATQATGSKLATNGADAASLSAQTEAASQSANQLTLAKPIADTGLSGVQEPQLFQTALNLQTPGMVGPSTYDFSMSPLQTQATNAGLTSADVVKGLKTGATQAGSAIGQVGQFLRDNKELVSMGGTALASMYGPEAEKAELLKSQDAFNRSIYNRRMANLNSPVSLYNKGA